MYKVLLVDDEEVICQGLQKLIDWEYFGFEIVGTANDGEEGAEKALRLMPDLILTDIKMPHRNGLEMIRQLQSAGFQGRFILTTGYADFEYAQSAIRFGVKAYLLKPVDERSLVGELYQIRKELDRQAKVSGGKSSSAPSDEMLLEQYLSGNLPYEELNRRLASPWIRIPQEGFQMVLARIVSDLPEPEMARMVSMVRQGTELKGQSRIAALSSRMLLFLFAQEDTRAGMELIGLRERLENVTKTPVRLACGNPAVPFSELPREYQRVRALFQNEFLFGFQGVIQAPKGKSACGSGETGFQELGRFLTEALETCQGDRIAEKLCDWMEHFVDSVTPELQVKLEYINLYIWISGWAANHYPELKERICGQQDFIQSAYLVTSIVELNDLLTRVLLTAAQEIFQYAENQGFQRIISYVDKHYAENLTLEAIARQFHYNKTYLGRKFGEAAGTHFNAYLNQIRIEKAKQFLQQGYKVHVVSEMTGYANVDYFTNRFKELTGMTPTQYRMSLQPAEGEKRIGEK